MSVFNLKKGKLIARSDQIEDELLSVAIIKVYVCVCVCVCVCPCVALRRNRRLTASCLICW